MSVPSLHAGNGRSRASVAPPCRVLIGLLLAVLATLLAYLSFRAYLEPDFLLHFANAFYC